ncbi:MAG: leucyl aminopeptidase family protein [Rhodovarius sp.]|nr:leucyl aminopeptidase family protein [Rhodovarius sp.]MCX7933399.1 leucyl aminopeptidase family protein [Rhodovarius sp.]MDW8315927.1 leucyl aminopeptidase family protein [Rhodovarius sp.]
MLDFLATGGATLPLFAVRPEGLAALPAEQLPFLRASGFAGRAGQLQLLPGSSGLAGAVLGLGEGPIEPWSFASLPDALPEGSAWHLVDQTLIRPALLGWGLGAYRYIRFKSPQRSPARLAVPEGLGDVLAEIRAIHRVRDLINTPANLLGPAELAEAVAALAAEHGARCRIIEGPELAQGFPAVQAVGGGSPRAPRVAVLEWGSAEAPLIALCGKGVCFDTGGLDLKPSSAMLRMKKDMGGAAVLLGVAEVLMARRSACRILLLVGAVENAISGRAFRPLDVIRTRRGLTVEVGNTDAEGRLVLADLIAFAAEHEPALLIDAATLTGAARIALGPDLPALFANDEGLAAALLSGAEAAGEPLWRLPLHAGYESWLESKVADLSNVAGKPMAGAIVAALFLRRFVPPGLPWAHIDLYAWNDSARPGRPEGGEATGLRALVAGIERWLTKTRAS